MARPKALVTGASGGIGYALAECFARDGIDLILVARSKQKLEQIAVDWHAEYGIEARVMAKDLLDAEAAVQIYKELTAEKIQVDYLVNNAGFGGSGPFLETDLEREQLMMRLNMLTLTQLSKLFLRDMAQRGSGRVLNVASTAGFLPGPNMAVYYATKAYVLSLSEALANEMRGTGVSVTALCPGLTVSGFQDGAGINGLRLTKLGMMKSDTVARAGYKAMLKGKAIVVPGIRNKLMIQLLRMMPRTLVTRLVRFLQSS